MSQPTILAACRDPALFAPWFRGKSWQAWFVFLAALFGLPMSEEDRVLFQRCTGRAAPPPGGVFEAWLRVGRRGGKSLILALTAVYLAVFRDWTPHLAPGERGVIMIIATDRRQARVIFRYVAALLKVPMIAPLVLRETADTIDLGNSITIEIHAASFRSPRGYTLIAALVDEIAYLRSDESANPDTEILAAIRPAMATVPGAMLLCASSPYARRGALWDADRKFYGQDGPVLVWAADTRMMNPMVPQRVIDEAFERDPASAAAEYGAEYRSDVETFVSRDVVDAAVVPGRHELPPMSFEHYIGFADAAGGSGGDSFTSAVAHLDSVTKHIVLDAVRERRPPFSPEVTIQEHAAFFKQYGVRKIVADRWGGQFPVEQFAKHGVTCTPSEKVKSDIYKELLPSLNSGRIELLDNPRLIGQLCGLERRTARGGKDSIDHAPGASAHDDIINAAAGALVLAATASQPMNISPSLLARASVPTQWARPRSGRFGSVGGRPSGTTDVYAQALALRGRR